MHRLQHAARRGCSSAPGMCSRLHHQHARTDAVECDDASCAGLAAIETDVIRSESGGKAGRIEQLRIELVDLHPERSRLLIPVQRKIAVEFLQTCRTLVD